MTSPADSAHPVAPPQEPTIERIALASGPAHSRSDWEKAAAGVLRKSRKLAEDDADELVWDRLTRTTLDGIAVTPLGTREDTARLTTTGRPTRAGAWDVRAWFADPDVAATRSAVLTDLENGVTSIWLQVGADAVPVDGLGTVLTDVLLDVAPVVLDASGDQLAAARAFADVARGMDLAAGTNLGVDPVGAQVRRDGLGAVPASDGVVEAADLADQLGCRALVVDGTVVHDLGASDVQELGYVLAVGAAYLRALVDAGRTVAEANALLEFRLAVTDEQFPTIAKLRAVRRLWARILELSGVSTGSTTETGTAMHVHAVTSRPMMTKYDPWVNMLRTCVATFSAGVGGADAVTVLPFDARIGLPDAFSRRIARNTSALLVDESHVARVADPAGGAYAVERLTDDLAVAAWEELGRLETSESGDHGSLAGLPGLAGRIEAVVDERDRQVARRKRPITGLSEFPNLVEALPERRPYPAGVPEVRSYGHAFEALRDAPATAPVFLATMGPVAAHTARATFASNLFAAGGIATVNPGRLDDVDAVVAAYTGPDGGQPVVCLTGSDAAYAAWGADLVAALRDAGARHVILAGKPGETTVAADLVDDSCAMGLDALAFLRRTREQLS
ncbi:MAG TPA: methylmalonyl-CoA mutase family protein [Marmoricola sp.]|nr:methylmalonyl-CoA mutase family protein [Marmoricola sp.]